MYRSPWSHAKRERERDGAVTGCKERESKRERVQEMGQSRSNGERERDGGVRESKRWVAPVTERRREKKGRRSERASML
jgi:hypothetical protein